MSKRPFPICLLAVILAIVTQQRPSTVIGQAPSPNVESYKLNQLTLAGSHNTYDKGKFLYLYDALSSVQVIELDVWRNFSVSHGFTPGSNNNCPQIPKDKNGFPIPPPGSTPGTRNQDLNSCIDDLRYWHDRNPQHPLVIVKLEMKVGFCRNTILCTFAGSSGNSPADLDNLILDPAKDGTPRRLTPNMIYKPEDLMCPNWPNTCADNEKYQTPEEAVQKGGWPTFQKLRGKFMFVIVLGSVSAKPYTPSPDGSVQYAAFLANRQARLAFPSALLTSATVNVDPRKNTYGNTKSWVVVFDMESGYLEGNSIPSVFTDWMSANNFLIFISDHTPFCPPPASARGGYRINYLANRYHANVIDTDQELIVANPITNPARLPMPNVPVNPIWSQLSFAPC